MKKTASLLLILGFSIGISAQKKTQKKDRSKDQTTAIAAAEAAAASTTDAVYAVGIENNEIDTIQINAGKPYVFLIDVQPYSAQSINVGGDQEEKELMKNFAKNSFKYSKITKHSYVTFENGQFMDVSGIENSYQAIVYWSGNNDDDIQVQEGKSKATEFVAQQLGVKKESSYLVNDRNFRKEIAALQAKNNFTPKSKMVMDAYLKRLSIPSASFVDEREIIFNKNQEKVKTFKTFIMGKNGKKIIYEKVELNEKGQPISVINYSREGDVEQTKKFLYKNDVLDQIQTTEKKIAVNYNDTQLILTQNVGEADETQIFWLENDELLEKTFTLMQNENYAETNMFSEEKLKNNCVNRLINDELWTNICSSKQGEFPFTYSYTSYQDGEILQKKNYKITKKSEGLYEYFGNNDEDEKNAEPLKLKGTYHLNEKNLISSFNFLKDDEAKKIEVEYTYFP